MGRPKRYEVLWSTTAGADLEGLLLFAAQESPTRARKLLSHLKTRAQTLVRFPLRGRVVLELKQIGVETYRELIVRPYRILYRIRGRKVFVLGLLDGRRDLEDVLLERFARL